MLLEPGGLCAELEVVWGACDHLRRENVGQTWMPTECQPRLTPDASYWDSAPLVAFC